MESAFLLVIKYRYSVMFLININYFTLSRLAYLKNMNSDLKRSNKTLTNRE